MNNAACFMNDFNRTYQFARPDIPDFARTLVLHDETFTANVENMLLVFNEIRGSNKGLGASISADTYYVRIYKTMFHDIYIAEFYDFIGINNYSYRAELVDAQTVIDTYLDNPDCVAYNNCDIADVIGACAPVF